MHAHQANFLFNNMQDFKQTTHVGQQDPFIFISNTNFYFYAMMSAKDLMEESHNSHVMAISTWSESFGIL